MKEKNIKVNLNKYIKKEYKCDGMVFTLGLKMEVVGAFFILLRSWF